MSFFVLCPYMTGMDLENVSNEARVLGQAKIRKRKYTQPLTPVPASILLGQEPKAHTGTVQAWKANTQNN